MIYELFFSPITDIDECKLSTPVCGKNAFCVNEAGTYGCFCNSGYEGDGLSCEGKTTK